MTLTIDKKIEVELSFSFKIDMWSLTNFHPVLESLKTIYFNGIFLRKVYAV